MSDLSPLTHLIYRLWRLRRLLVLCTALMLAGCLFAGLYGGGASAFSQPGAVVHSMAWAVGALALHVVLFPRATFSTLGYALCAGICLGLEPWHQSLLGSGEKGAALLSRGQIIGALVPYALIGWAILCTLLLQVSKFLPAPKVTFTTKAFVPSKTAADLRAAYALSPNATRFGRRYGAMDAEGWVSVRTPQRGHDTRSFAIVELPVFYKVRLVEDLGHKMRLEVDTLDGVQFGLRTQFRDVPGGAQIVHREGPLPFNPLLLLLFWLSDMTQDGLRFEIDTILGRPSPSLSQYPVRELSLTLLRPVGWIIDRLFPRPQRQPNLPDVFS